jgi:hypothetical protein
MTTRTQFAVVSMTLAVLMLAGQAMLTILAIGLHG